MNSHQIFKQIVRAKTDYDKTRLSTLYTGLPVNQELLLGKPQTGTEIDVLDHLESLTPEGRTQFLGQMYKHYTKAYQQNLIDFARISG